MEAIRNYVEALFAGLPQRGDVLRVKEDMLANLEDKFTALLDEGKNEDEATGIVIASIGSAEELREELGLADNASVPDTEAKAPHSGGKIVDPTVAEEYRRYQERKHVMIAVAVALFILSPFTCDFFEETLHYEAFGTFIFFAMIAAGVALCILSGRRDDYYCELFDLGRDEEDTEDKEEEREYPISTMFSSIAFPIAAAAYLCIGVFWGLWHPGWLIFVFCAALTAAVAAVEHFRRQP